MTLFANTATASSIGFAGTWDGTNIDQQAPATSTLSFGNLSTLFADGAFSGYQATMVKDLDLALLSSSVVGNTIVALYGIAGGYDGTAWKTYQDGLGNIITFDLDLDATWRRTFDLGDGDVNYEQDENGAGVFEYTGLYTFSDGSQLVGRGEMNASATGTAQTFEVTQAAIPVPASVMGLMSGLGMLAAFRVRRRRSAAA